jgi:signal transduction histidine kinase
MPDGGCFDVALRAGADGSSVTLTLRDSGHGIEPDVRARVFEPFFTTKPVGRGTGLGLSVARDLVVAAGGRIEVDSEAGRGTAFHVVLPALVRRLADA